MPKDEKKPPVVSSLTLAFRKAVNPIPIEDREEAKTAHRSNLQSLVSDYMLKLEEGKVDGIRNAKDLVEVIKADLLLMGEANERTETNSTVEETKVMQVAQTLDLNDPSTQAVMDQMLKALNQANDDEDRNIYKG